MKASDFIASYLFDRGVTSVFEMSGGMITHLLDSLHQARKIRIVSVHHEQAAAFAVDGWARMTGVPGVAMATSGPGATNLLTGIGSCYFDSTPAVFITGQVNRHEMKGDRAIRQLGFQETDIVSMARPITKAARVVDDPAALPKMLDDAFALAVAGRPGPVLLDIPMDVQRCNVEPPGALENRQGRLSHDRTGTMLPAETYRELFEAFEQSFRPLILLGGGVRSARCVDLARALTARLGAPVVHSLMAVDALPATDPLRIGLIGSYGNRWANHALGRADFLLVLGSRLDVRQTGSETQAFRGDKTIFHVDCEPGEINNRITDCRAVVADLPAFLAGAVDIAGQRSLPDRSAWLDDIHALRSEWPDTGELAEVPGINPNALMHALSSYSGVASAFVVDVGQHQMWAAQSLDLGPAQRFLTSGGMGSMGFALPAAVGVAAADNRPAVVIAGDGGFQANIQELQTVVRNRLPIKTVIVNNRCHGMVRQFQQSYFHERYQSTLWGYSAPDFEHIAAAYGLSGATVAEPGDVDAALRRLWADPLEPALLQVMVDTYANAYPKLAFGLPITEMEPLAKPLEMEGT
ncbi:MAG: thiamine pyrophosphate-binding protein [Capsulimonadaceae bacterium]